jgi:hypothetical protein
MFLDVSNTCVEATAMPSGLDGSARNIRATADRDWDKFHGGAQKFPTIHGSRFSRGTAISSAVALFSL